MGFLTSYHFLLGALFLRLFSIGCAQDTGNGDTASPSSPHSTSLLPDGSVRLRDGFQPYQGRVEIYYQGNWVTICDATWSMHSAIVLCRQLGYRAVDSARVTFGEGSGPIFLEGLNCGGDEDSLVDCSMDGWVASGMSTCDHSQDVGVVCGVGGEWTTPSPSAVTDGSLRLADGTEANNGRVEIYYQGEWGTICRDQSDNMTTHVICRQFGYSTADPQDAVPNGGFGPGSGPIHLGHVVCDGTESKLAFCSHDKWGENDCTHDDDVMVSCKTYTPPEDGELRLVAGTDAQSGQVEISYQGVWGTVCDKDWTIEEATVVCRQLGFRPARASLSYAYFLDQDSINPVFLDSVECDGAEDRLEDCTHEWRSGVCDHSEDVGVICGAPEKFKPVFDKEDGRVRLGGGSYPHNGRVEIKYQGSWGTVCDQEWNLEAANVVCHQLGYPSADSALPRAFFGHGAGIILLDRVSCEGRESELAFCNHAKWGDNKCDHAQDASVVCTAPTPEGAIPDGSVRLVDGESPIMGRLEVHYQGVWGTVCGDNWSSVNSDIVCQQLGYPTADPKITHYVVSADGTAPIVLDEVTCSGNERRLVDCSHDGWAITDCSHQSDVGVKCSELTTTSIPDTTHTFTTRGPTKTSTPFPDVFTTPAVVHVTEDGSGEGSGEGSGDGENGVSSHIGGNSTHIYVLTTPDIVHVTEDGSGEESGDGENGVSGHIGGNSTSPPINTKPKGVLSIIWVIVLLILMVPAILIIFIIGMIIKRRYTTTSYKPVNQTALPMKDRV